ncbi:MAG: A/G-specific adenine glycosylase [Clostridia bacterium]|nr:A/G-specific adenine glycosylase [Clostridia bacterium]
MTQKKYALDDDLCLLKEALEKLLAWYLVSARDLPWRKTTDPYKIWISEIMLQQTRVEAVKEYYARFLGELPDIGSLADATEEQVLKLWEGLGYYSRARNLKKAAEVIVSEYDGVFPSRWEQIRKLPGIGDYTAGSISSIAFGLPYPAVDGNVLRVVSRLLNSFDDITEQKTKTKMTDMLKQVYPAQNCSEVTQSLMELGAIICIPNGQPKCEECPLQSLCRANCLGTVSELPVKKGKAKRKIQPKTVFLLQCGDEYAIQKREEKGLLYGMWQLPNCDGHWSVKEIRQQFFNSKSVKKLDFYRHIFTHIEWEMMGYHIIVEEKNSDYLWKTAEEIRENYAIPGAFRPFLKAMKT